MKVAIAGAGLAGSYLYRRLDGMHDVEIFDLKQTTQCGLAPCAWATSREFETYVVRSGLDPKRYIRNIAPTVYLDSMPIEVDLVTFDKPQFIKDLLGAAAINYSSLEPARYDRVIDATGAWRAFLPSTTRDLHIPSVQYLVQTEKSLKTRISFVKVGYGWCFALSAGRYHIGCASLTESPRERLKSLGWLPSGNSVKVLCNCSGAVRVASVHDSQPFVSTNANSDIWGVGEAIGCVSPLVGEGIVPSLRSVELLLKHWDDADHYTKAILAGFDWMRDERSVVDRLISGKRLGIRDAWIIKKNSNRMGIKVGSRIALMLFKGSR